MKLLISCGRVNKALSLPGAGSSFNIVTAM